MQIYNTDLITALNISNGICKDSHWSFQLINVSACLFLLNKVFCFFSFHSHNLDHHGKPHEILFKNLHMASITLLPHQDNEWNDNLTSLAPEVDAKVPVSIFEQLSAEGCGDKLGDA